MSDDDTTQFLNEKRSREDVEVGLAQSRPQDTQESSIVTVGRTVFRRLAACVMFFLLLNMWTHAIDDMLLRRPNCVQDYSAKDKWNVSYVSVSGFFVQDKKKTDPDEVGPTPNRFGLVYDHHDYWKKFDKKIKKLNKKASRHTAYKVVWMGRHGEGYHNVAQEYYGDEAWNAKWARKNGNGTITWGPDAKLTNLGISQAERVHSLWQRELSHGGSIPHPTALFVSPLSRAMSTLAIAYAGIVTNGTQLSPLIMEGLRDEYGLRTADKRANRTLIHLTHPSFRFEDGFAEEDELWMPGERESDEHRVDRTAGALDEIMRVGDTYLSIVGHSKTVEDTLKLSGHREYDVPTGGVVPLVLKVTYTPVPGSHPQWRPSFLMSGLPYEHWA